MVVRLHVVAEGQTEEGFVKRVLAPSLWPHGVVPDVHCITTGKRHGRTYRGGLVSYAHLRRDLELWMQDDPGADACFTTMVDLYRLPPDFPGYELGRRSAGPLQRAEFLEEELARDLGHPRFVPYIQVHEFEALLFAAPAKFAVAYPDRPSEISRLLEIRQQFPSPEHIDDGDHTAPSKRIRSVLPAYDKPAAGLLISQAVGIEVMRRECSHFASWLQKLECLSRSRAQ